MSENRSVVSYCLQPRGLYSPWNSPDQNTGVGSFSLLQGIFPTQGSNPGLLHCRWILYQLSHKGSPRILEWVAYPFSRGSSRPRNQPGVSCIAGGRGTPSRVPVPRRSVVVSAPIGPASPYRAFLPLLFHFSHFSRVRLCATLWTAAHQAPRSTGFSRQEYWSG